MPQFRLTINCENNAFQPNPSFELARILSEIADRLRSLGTPDYAAPIRDINGARVGSYIFEGE